MVGLHRPGEMGFSASLACVLLLCCVVTVVVPHDPWDFDPKNPVVWGPSATTSSSGRQASGLSLGQSSPWAWLDVSQPRALSSLQPVTVQCREAQVVVRVNRDLFGTGRLIQAADLTLGIPGCQPTSFDAAEDAAIFEVGLHECGSTLQMTLDSLVYSISLYYNPNSGNPVVIRTSPAEVPIECHYPRKDNVNRKVIKPTWVPFSSSISAEQKLTFSLRLMNDDWSTERASRRYQLGDVIHVQADVNTEVHIPLRLFIDSCVASLSPDRDSSPQYVVIDYNGCLIDGNWPESSSAFLAPRPKETSLQFTLDVFRFAVDPQALVYINCHLKATSADQAPNPSNKACSFNKGNNTWSSVEGASSICHCCESKDCESVGGQFQRGQLSWRTPGRRFQRDVSLLNGAFSKMEVEADVAVGPLFIPDVQKVSKSALEWQTRLEDSGYDALEDPGIEIMLWIMVGSSLVALVAVVLGFIIVCKKPGVPRPDPSISLTML